MKTLADIRTIIDEHDQQLAELLARRAMDDASSTFYASNTELNKLFPNISAELVDRYLSFLPVLCSQAALPFDEGKKDELLELDKEILELLEKRIACADDIMKLKYEADKNTYDPLIKAKDVEGIRKALYAPEREEAVCERVGALAEEQGLLSSTITAFYEQHVIPLTISREIAYLLK
jgi:chorismate mutase